MTGSLLEGMTLVIFGYYFLWAILGKVFSYVLQQYKVHKEIQASGGFQIGYFIRDNWKRFVAAIIAMSLGVLFSDSLLGITLNELSALTAGFTTDVVIDRFRKGYAKGK